MYNKGDLSHPEGWEMTMSMYMKRKFYELSIPEHTTKLKTEECDLI